MKRKKKKVIGTGLSGLIGSRIVELLGKKYDFIDFSKNKGVDILDFLRLDELFKEHEDADLVLHLAAFTDTYAAWEQRGDKKGSCYYLNVEGTKNIVQLCQKYNKYLVYFSTDFVFNGEKKEFYTEADNPDPIEWYGKTKLLGEQIVQKNLSEFSIVRISSPFRAKFDPRNDILRKRIENLREEKLYPLFDDQVITPTFIDDIAKAMELFIEKKPVGIYHLSGSTSLTPYKMALVIAEVFNFDKNLIKKGSLADYQATMPSNARPWQKRLAISNKKITKLGIRMKTFKKALMEVKRQMRK